jgi:hypothetical protein
MSPLMCLLAFIMPSLSTVHAYRRVYVVMLIVYWSEVLPSVKIHIAVFWIVMMRSLVVSTTVLVEPAIFFFKADYVGSRMFM